MPCRIATVALWMFVLTFCCAGFTLAGEAAQAPAQRLPPARAVARKAVDAIVMDGRLEEESWKEAQALPIEIVHNKGQKVEPVGLGRFTWDDEAFYVAFEVFDATVQAKGDGRGERRRQEPDAVVVDDAERRFGRRHGVSSGSVRRARSVRTGRRAARAG